MEENYLLAKWLNNELTETELNEFKNQPDYYLYEKIKNYSSQLETSNFNSEEMFNNIINTKKETVKVIPFYNKIYFKIAALLILSLGMLLSYQLVSSTNIKANLADTTTFILPDNSEVVLNSDSEINYKKWNWEDNRNLELKGEAFFKVAKGKKFSVKTKLGEVNVLGTQFNVKSRNNRFDITCYEGKVKVIYNKNEHILTKGKTISVVDNVKILEQDVNDVQPTWLSNQISFEKENLINVIEEIERNYNIKINEDNFKTNQLFTGKLPSNNLSVALELIASTYHLKIIKINSTSYSIEETN